MWVSVLLLEGTKFHDFPVGLPGENLQRCEKLNMQNKENEFTVRVSEMMK